jgi:hypothetical protein
MVRLSALICELHFCRTRPVWGRTFTQRR